MVKTGLTQHRIDPAVKVPWTGFDLINTFNAWKKGENAGRVFGVDPDGMCEIVVTGLTWRGQVYQQVFAEAAVDCGRALAAWSHSRSGGRKGQRVGFPRFKKKTSDTPSFRLRNKHPKNGKPAIRVGEAHRRSVRLPGIGIVRVHDDTRRSTAGLEWTEACQRFWLPLRPMARKLHASTIHPNRLPRGWFVSADWQNRYPARRKDQTIVATPQPGWRATTIASVTFADTFCTRYRLS